MGRINLHVPQPITRPHDDWLFAALAGLHGIEPERIAGDDSRRILVWKINDEFRDIQSSTHHHLDGLPPSFPAFRFTRTDGNLPCGIYIQLSPQVNYNRDGNEIRLNVEQTLFPETVLATMRGRRIEKFVHHPALELAKLEVCDALVTSSTTHIWLRPSA